MTKTEARAQHDSALGTAYWSYGTPGGDLYVFVHGFRGDHHGLEPLAKQLTGAVPHAVSGVEIVVPDLPGFGRSEELADGPHDLTALANWLIRFVENIGRPVKLLLGHSFGSLVVSRALMLGLKTERLALINPISAPALEGPKAVLTALARTYYATAARLPEPLAHRLLANRAIVRAMSIAMAKTADLSTRAWIHEQHDLYFSDFSSADRLLESFTASISHTVTEFAEHATMPTLLLAGDRDDITPLTEQLKLAKLIPGAQLRVARGVGHLIHYEAIEFAAGHIAEFMESRVNQ